MSVYFAGIPNEKNKTIKKLNSMYDEYPKYLDKNIKNMSLNKIKNNFIHYYSFKKTYFKSKKLNDKYITDLENVIYEVTPLIKDEKSLLRQIEQFYNMDENHIFENLLIYFSVHSIKNVAYESLFFSYKKLIEHVLEEFIKLRKTINDDNDMDLLLEDWNTYDENNKINTSSTLLYFMFNNHDTKEKYKWNTNKNDNIDKKITVFLDKVKEVDFKYIGFCPYDSLNRLMILMKFPLKELLDCIPSNPIIIKYNDLVTFIKDNRYYLKYKLSIPTIKEIKLKRIDLSDIKKKIQKTRLIEIYINFLEYIFDCYIKYASYLIQTEKKFYDFEKKIEELNNMLNI